MAEYSPDELLDIPCACQIRPGERIVVGVSSPIESAGAMLAKELHAPSARYNVPGMGESYFRASHEFSGFAQTGKLDLFFPSAVQIDAEANINLQYIAMRKSRRSASSAHSPPRSMRWCRFFWTGC